MCVIHIIGGGLAGCEAAWQAAETGADVTIHEMRPVRPTAVHQTDGLAELVCSNSFRADKVDNAVGLIKEEMRRLGSLVMRAADATRVPAGAALAVDRHAFSKAMTNAVQAHPRIRVDREEVVKVPGTEWSPVIIATGPLTSEALSQDIQAMVGEEHLSFYDAISPIVLAESIDMSKVFRASRWGRNVWSADPGEALETTAEGDYLNCPMSKAEYDAFHAALVSAESATVHDFDNTKFFEGCLPIEVMAHRGEGTLRFGPMKPVGLKDPRTGQLPYAVVQLRQDTLAGDHYSLVGFQTQIKWGDQSRLLKLIPGLENAEFVRFGMVHRNTYIRGPKVLLPTWQTRDRADLFFAGQVSGVEGYVESAASGLVAGRNAAALARGETPQAPPRTTAIGSLAYYVSHADPKTYQPTNITHGIMPPLDNPPRDKMKKKLMIAERALADLNRWLEA
ncbi:MAG: methylenetetrahydrofolate--tRNA-(uracil(54)-C(5))-methyltransferase (FADH(2)-oxidizing) TrmFO [Acidobacteria bacterium]|nr:methylenetetrahydrofolate--tRNA-(uracil(54)-C(5))-methyltransferase (FADH(2)-oxidizing) TrmFO [Acidobacteriota bacterium]MSO60530.1 methylenetetrahydrofolate--tRNA-(uracil(54)-C(5))-methyltransferase (FADH(2)-oxidizing) TrmFO [Acidobacteriota bacterium]